MRYVTFALVLFVLCVITTPAKAETYQHAYVCQDALFAETVAKKLQFDQKTGFEFMQLALTEVTRDNRPMCQFVAIADRDFSKPVSVIVDTRHQQHIDIIPVQFVVDGTLHTGFAVQPHPETPHSSKPEGTAT